MAFSIKNLLDLPSPEVKVDKQGPNPWEDSLRLLTPPPTPSTGQQWTGCTPTRPKPYHRAYPYRPYPNPVCKKTAINPNQTRFATPLSRSELDQACKKVIPQSTGYNNAWATRVFTDWLNERNLSSQEKYPNILECLQPLSKIDLVLASFVLESRRKDGKCYPPNTLRNILGALYRVLKDRFGAENFETFMEKDRWERCYPHLNNAMHS